MVINRITDSIHPSMVLLHVQGGQVLVLGRLREIYLHMDHHWPHVSGTVGKFLIISLQIILAQVFKLEVKVLHFCNKYFYKFIVTPSKLDNFMY